MKKITILLALFAFVSGFGQQQISMMGDQNAIVYDIPGNTNGSPEAPCTSENMNGATIENGFNTSSASDFVVANDLTVAADEQFTLTNITVYILANGGITNVDVTYYDDNAGLPGNVVGSELSVDIDDQNVIGNGFGFDLNEVEMSVDPFVFEGQAGVPTTYWIEASVTDGGSTGSVFWLVTSANMNGLPTAQFDAGWSIPDPVMDGVYSFGGECDVLGVSDNTLAGFNYYPNPSNGILNLSANKNIEAVSFYNLLGQNLLSLDVNEMTSEVNIEGFAKGAYVMQVTIDGQIGSYQILKN